MREYWGSGYSGTGGGGGGGGGAAWLLTGNAGTNPVLNFAGTTDAQDFVLRANNVEQLRILSSGGVTVLNGPLNLTDNTGTAAQVRFFEPSGGGTNYTAVQAQAQAVDITYTLPSTQGENGTFLRNDGAGGLAWLPTPEPFVYFNMGIL